MDANPFRSTHSILDFSPGARWGAIVTSALASVCLALLFPVVYLFVDLLVTRGQIPDYSSVNAARHSRMAAYRLGCLALMSRPASTSTNP